MPELWRGIDTTLGASSHPIIPLPQQSDTRTLARRQLTDLRAARRH